MNWLKKSGDADKRLASSAATATATAADDAMLRHCATTFPLGGLDHVWGITQQAVCHRLAITPAATADTRWQTLPGGQYFGLDIAQVQIGRPSVWPDRPVNQVWYAVRRNPAVSHLSQARVVHERFVEAFGAPPSGSTRFDVRKESYPGSIAARAEWRSAGVRWSYSTYGAPRPQSGSDTVGFIALDWHDEVSMATPFFPEWQARNAVLASIDDAERIASVHMASAETRAHRRYHFDADTDPNADPRQVMATRLLYFPDRLLTPPAIASLDDGKGFWIWRSKQKRCWGASSKTDTVVFHHDAPARCCWQHTLPARGPGTDQIVIGTLSAARSWSPREHSRDLAEFVTLLQQLPGAHFQFIESMDD